MSIELELNYFKVLRNPWAWDEKTLDWALKKAEIEAEQEVNRILAMSDAEIIADCISQGKDPKDEAEKVRAIFLRALEHVSGERSGG
jgi:hypothetical protein